MTVSIWLQSCPFSPRLLLLQSSFCCCLLVLLAFHHLRRSYPKSPAAGSFPLPSFLPSFSPCRHQFRTGSLLCPSIALGSSRGEAPLDSDFSKPHRACRLQLPAPHNLRLPYCAIPSHYPPCNTDLNLCARSLGDLQVAV